MIELVEIGVNWLKYRIELIEVVEMVALIQMDEFVGLLRLVDWLK